MKMLLSNYYQTPAVILFCIGFCMLLFDRNLLKKVLGLDIMDTGVFLLLADRGFISGGKANIIGGGVVLDAILFRMIEKKQHREEIINAGFDSAVVEKIHGMVMENEKKRYQFPPVLRLSPCAFGHEWLMPLVNHYCD